MSNAERQRRFRARNPGYNRKYSGHPTAAQRRRAKQTVLETMAKAEAHVQLVLNSTICKPLPLMLPAPVEIPVIPGMNAIPTISVSTRQPAHLAALVAA